MQNRNTRHVQHLHVRLSLRLPSLIPCSPSGYCSSSSASLQKLQILHHTAEFMPSASCFVDAEGPQAPLMSMMEKLHLNTSSDMYMMNSTPAQNLCGMTMYRDRDLLLQCNPDGIQQGTNLAGRSLCGGWPQTGSAAVLSWPAHEKCGITRRCLQASQEGQQFQGRKT